MIVADLMTVILLSVGIASEALLYPLWIKFGFTWLLVFIHVFAILCMAASFQLDRMHRMRKKMYEPLTFFGIILISFLPFFGLFGVVLLLLAVRGLGKAAHSGLYEDFEAESAAREPVSILSAESSNLLSYFREEVSFQPFVDILSGDDDRVKASAIQKLSKHMNRENVILLLRALKDRSADVRLYAASALLKMETALNNRIQKARLLVKVKSTIKAYASLGDLYLLYAESGFLEQVLRDYYLGLAADCYRNALDMRTDNHKVVLAYAKCLVKRGHFDRAKVLLDYAMKIFPHDEGIIFLRNEIAFRTATYADIRENFMKVNPQALSQPDRIIYEYWMEGAGL